MFVVCWVLFVFTDVRNFKPAFVSIDLAVYYYCSLCKREQLGIALMIGQDSDPIDFPVILL